MSRSGFKLNPKLQTQWKDSMRILLSLSKKQDPESMHKVVTLSARRFVKNVAAVTPPATGELNSDAKKRGEDAILADLLKLAIPTTVVGSSKAAKEALTTAETLMEIHDKARSGAKGRVNPRSRKEKLFVSSAVFNRVLKQLQQRVGWLAAGLNAAADRLGFSLPAWIKRHGQRYGAITVRATDTSISIRIIQNVPFADDVANYPRRWNFALQKEITSIGNQVKAIWARKTAAARARLKR